LPDILVDFYYMLVKMPSEAHRVLLHEMLQQHLHDRMGRNLKNAATISKMRLCKQNIKSRWTPCAEPLSSLLWSPGQRFSLSRDPQF